MKTKLVYLASPYSHPDPVVRATRYEQACRCAALIISTRFMVFSPVAHCHRIAQVGVFPGDWKFWQEFDLRMLKACDELWVLTVNGYMESEGISAEICHAVKLGKPIHEVGMDGVLLT